jgi:hypothetical protein
MTGPWCFCRKALGSQWATNANANANANGHQGVFVAKRPLAAIGYDS